MASTPLLNLPGELAEKILQFLPSYDLLTLRSVCHTTKAWIENLTSARDWKDYQLSIDGSESRNFGSVLDLGLPFSSFYINNSETTIYTQSHVNEFLETFGNKITRLKVHYHGTFYSDEEYNFMTALQNLEELELEVIDVTRRTPIPRFPTNFEKLKVLKPGRIISEKPFGTDYNRLLIFACPNLTFLQYPYVVPRDHREGFDNDLFNDIRRYIKEQLQRGNGRLLEYLDMKPMLGQDKEKEHWEMDNQTSSFYYFVEYIAQKNKELRFYNVPAEYLNEVTFNADHEQIPDSFDMYDYDCIVSLNGFVPAVKLLPLENLEEITIQALSKAEFKDNWDFSHGYNLRSIKINFDSDVKHNMVGAGKIVEFLLHDQNDDIRFRSREAVTNLELTFEDADREVSDLVNARLLTAKLANLTTLKLVDWNPVNRAFVRLWRGMQFLEELYIADCGTLGNVGFFGQDLAKPVFLQLTRLKKLTLKLDGMPNVTDTFFVDVLSHVKLEEFNLMSESPLTKVTAKGIKALANGEFGSSIKKFRFHTWSLANTSNEEFLALRNLFRLRTR